MQSEPLEGYGDSQGGVAAAEMVEPSYFSKRFETGCRIEKMIILFRCSSTQIGTFSKLLYILESIEAATVFKGNPFCDSGCWQFFGQWLSAMWPFDGCIQPIAYNTIGKQPKQ